MIRSRSLYLLIFGIAVSCTSPDQFVKSPNGVVSAHLFLEDGQVSYMVLSGNDTVITRSALGLELSDESFTIGLELVGVSESEPIADHYEMYHGKQAVIDYTANRKVYTFKNMLGHRMDVVFQVSDDGLGIRYRLPETTAEEKVISKEYTAFEFPAETKAWLQPLAESKSGWQQCNPSYEEHYAQGIAPNAASPMGQGWIFPALFQTSVNNWVLISETALDSTFCGSHLAPLVGKNGMAIAFAQPQDVIPGKGYLPKSKLPWATPWRVVALGSLETVVASTLGTDLAPEKIKMDESFIAPGIASWSWAVLKDTSVNYETTLEFIDYAADMQWKYCLIDADWDRRIGWEKLEKLSASATEKGIGLLVWYNSAGDWNTTPMGPRSQLLTHEDRMREFQKLRAIGIKGVKIDFFGGDGQSMIAYYHNILLDAAEAGLLVNFHGATLPRGWQRTYPNLMTMEAIRGFEFITFGQGDADREATHCAMLPFTRNVFDPMDFTPMCFSEIPGIVRKTTNAFELALPVLFLSGITHMAEIPEGMAAVLDFVKDYLKTIPMQWDETRLVAGFPGKDAVIARRKGEKWYISGINGESTEKSMELDLGFLSGKTLTLITDGNQHPEFKKTEITLDSQGKLIVEMKPAGGFVAVTN